MDDRSADDFTLSDEDLVAFLVEECEPALRGRIERASRESATVRERLSGLRELLLDLQHSPEGASGTALSPALRSRLLAAFAGRPRGWLTDARQRAREFVAALVFEARPGLQTARGFRGASAGRHLIFECDDLEIDLRVSPVPGLDPARPETFCLMGQVSGGALPQRAIAARHSDGVQHPIAVSPDGGLEATLGSGEYELSLEFAERTIVVPRIEMPA